MPGLIYAGRGQQSHSTAERQEPAAPAYRTERASPRSLHSQTVWPGDAAAPSHIPIPTCASTPTSLIKAAAPRLQILFFYSEVTDILLWINRPLNENFNPPQGHCLRSRMELRLRVLTSVMKALSEMTPRGLPEAPDLCTPINFKCLQSMRTAPCPLTS